MRRHLRIAFGIAFGSTRYFAHSTQLTQNRIVPAFKVRQTPKLLTYSPQMMVLAVVAVRSDHSAPSAGVGRQDGRLLSTSTKRRLSI